MSRKRASGESRAFRSSRPVILGSKAVLDGNSARIRLSWAGGQFSTDIVRNFARRIVQASYPEASNIKLWRDPLCAEGLVATFHVDRSNPGFRASRYEVAQVQP